jgi:hypothetical protein
LALQPHPLPPPPRSPDWTAPGAAPALASRGETSCGELSRAMRVLWFFCVPRELFHRWERCGSLRDQPTRRDQPTISAPDWGPDSCRCPVSHGGHTTHAVEARGPSMPPHENSRRASGTAGGCGRRAKLK